MTKNHSNVPAWEPQPGDSDLVVAAGEILLEADPGNEISSAIQRYHWGDSSLARALRTAPHKCSRSKCPGNINRRKLELFDELLDVCKALDVWEKSQGPLVELAVIILNARAAVACVKEIKG